MYILTYENIVYVLCLCYAAKATVWFMESVIHSMPDHVTKFSILLDFSGQNNGTDIEFLRYFGKIFQVLAWLDLT